MCNKQLITMRYLIYFKSLKQKYSIRSLRSRSLRSLRKWESVILSYSIYKYYLYIYYRKMFSPRNLNDLNDLDLNDRIEYFCFKDLK